MKTIAILSIFLLTFCLTNAQTIHTLKLQPGPDDGKDAYTNSAPYYAADPHPNGRSLIASAYTYHGDYGIGRSFFAFNLSSLPVNAVVTEAKLNLFFDPENNHGVQTGDNASYLKRVTSDWDEQTLIWSTQPTCTEQNQVYLATSTSPYEDYIDIDVFGLVNDMIADPNNSYGFCLYMINENVYNSMIFASSDNPLSRLWPKLILSYYTCDTPEPDFSFANFGTTVHFSSISANNSSWDWDFGNGNHSNLQFPEFNFGAAGTYPVCLTVGNYCGETSTKCDSVVVCDSMHAGFGYDNSNELVVAFSNTSINASQYLWDFGDGEFSNEANPVHSYSFFGAYQVCLQIDNSCTSLETCDSVKVIPILESREPVKAFPNPSADGFSLQFTEPLDHFSYSILDASGKCSYSGKHTDVQYGLKIPSLSPGIYTLILNTGTFVQRIKLISIK